jgi:hypothetical protein
MTAASASDAATTTRPAGQGGHPAWSRQAGAARRGLAAAAAAVTAPPTPAAPGHAHPARLRPAVLAGHPPTSSRRRVSPSCPTSGQATIPRVIPGEVGRRSSAAAGPAVEAQPRAGQHGKRKEPLRVPVVAHPQPPAPRQPRDRALRLPPVTPQPARRLDATAGDAHLDPPAGQVGAAAAMIVGLVGVALVRAATPPAGRRAYPGEVVKQRLEHHRIVGVGPSHQHRQWQPATVNRQVQLRPALARSTGFAPVRSPRTTRRLNESTVTRDQSSAPVSPSSSSSTSWSRSNTPARAHSANRRQQLVTLPQPNSPTGSNATASRCAP